MSSYWKAENGQWYVERCGKCHRENYCMSVAQGVCCWCGWRPEDDKQMEGGE